MLRILGSPRRLCDGYTRREMLRAGGLVPLGLGLADFFRLQEAQAVPAAQETRRHFGKAKSCILLFLYGSPSQLETFDPASRTLPSKLRWALGVIPSRLPGLHVGELFPTAAKVMDRVTVVRSMNHPYPIHGVAYATTGIDRIDVPMELNPRDSRHWPFIGSVVDFLDRQQGKKRRPVPSNIALPFPFSSQRVGEVARAGPYAAFLGGACNPIWTQFKGQANRRTTKTLQQQTIDMAEPYMGITPESRFDLTGEGNLPADLTLDRLDNRRSLLEQFEQGRKDLDGERRFEAGASIAFGRLAYSLMGSDRVRQALDPGIENRCAARLVWDDSCLARAVQSYAPARGGGLALRVGFLGRVRPGRPRRGIRTVEHYPRMKNELDAGALDHALYGLISDLDGRGMLDETLVLLLSEHGRTPQIQNVKGGGRDHWSRAYSVMLSGGGVARGRVVGKTDRIASDVSERPVSPKDILATAYYLLGIDPETQLTDRLGRTLSLVPEGRVLTEVLA